jgi:hypothetical protein
MNRFLQTLIFGIFILLAISCKKQSFLDPQLQGIGEEDVFTDSTRTMGFLTNIYADVNFSFANRRFGSAGLSVATDEAEGPVNSSSNVYKQFISGAINPSNVSAGPYSVCYENIRAVNKLLINLPKSTFNAPQKQRVKGEALFLRAWYYAMLLKHYGGVPIVGDVIYGRNDDIPAIRGSYETTVNYVVAQCDSAAKYLSREYEARDYGRATTGACMALKSRVLLYAASPLFNGSSPFTGSPAKKMVSYDAFDANRWKLAADAAKAVMNLGYVLYDEPTVAPETRTGLGFMRVFYASKGVNNEFIFRGSVSGDFAELWLDQDFSPPTRGGQTNMNGSYPYQELADDFDMIDGKSITDPTAAFPYDPNNPYANRDPRFHYTILHNLTLKADFNSSNQLLPVYTHVGAQYDGIYVGTPTGYYANKMLRDSAANRIGLGTDRFYPLMRYAEVILNYAEATNEFSGPAADVYAVLTSIRKRAGITAGSDNLYGLKPNMTKEEMRKAIQHERRVEFAFEEQRFWDVRRWMIAPEVENRTLNGMEITKTSSGTYTYKKVPVRTHKFINAEYFWPFPLNEVSKPGGLTQNPGY